MKSLSLYKTIILLLTLLLAACQQPMLKQAAKEDPVVETESAAAKPLPFKSDFALPRQLTEETIYHYLVAELSIQRQQLDLAYEHFMLAASLANDKTAAEKAARIALLQKQTDAAMRAIAKWVDFDPNSLQARQLSAILHLRNDDLEAAEKQFNALLMITESQGSNGYLRIASLLASEKDKQRNLRLMQKLTASQSQNAQAHYAMALVEFEAQQFPHAMNSLAQAKALDPSWDKPYVLEAQMLASQGNNLAAQTSLEKALKVLPEERSLHQAYGRILVENEQYKQAIEAFRKAYELEPTDLDLLYAIGMLAMQAEDWETARESWNILLASDNRAKRDDANYFMGQLEELNDNPDKAMKHYMAVGKGKTRTESRLRLARLMARTGQLEKARAMYRELRVLNPHNAVQIYAAEAQVLRELDLLVQAVELYSAALKAYPENLDLRYARGLYAADSGNIELALPILRLSCTVNPTMQMH